MAEDAVKRAVKKGCDKAEIFIKSARRLSVQVKNSTTDALETARDFGMSLRVVKRQKLGFSYATDCSMLEDMVDEAVSGAEWTDRDENIGIPGSSAYPDVLIFDEEIEDAGEEEVIKSAMALEKTALDFDKRIKKVRKAEIELAVEKTTIFNSENINISYKSTLVSAALTAFADDGNDMQTGWEFEASRRLRYLNPASVAESASKKALSLLGSRKITSVRIPVILEPSVAASFLGLIRASVSAEAVQKKRSFLEGRVGSIIVSPLLNIFDDALLPWKIGTKPADDEGAPTSRKAVVSRGVLTGFIHNTYSARKDGVVSTGNASRNSFKELPGIDVTNFYIEPPGKGENINLLNSVSRGLLILETMGIHTANPVSGDFSIGISGLWVEGGEIAYPVKEAVMSGNILELFKKIERVGTDLKFYGKIGSPSLLIGDMDISA